MTGQFIFHKQLFFFNLKANEKKLIQVFIHFFIERGKPGKSSYFLKILKNVNNPF